MDTIMDTLLQAESAISEYESYLNLSANENSMSRTAKKYLSSIAADRYYFEGTSGGYSEFPEFIASGNQHFDDLMQETRHTLMEMFEAEYANLNPLSGIHAMLMVLLTLTEVGDSIASLSPQAHGHFSTAAIINQTGRKSVFLPTSDGEIDLSLLGSFVRETGSRMIYIDAMSYQQEFNIQRIRASVGADVIIVFDASHTLGLIAGGMFPNPLSEGADVVCGNTHKTFPGPHRGIILTKSHKTGDVITEEGSSLYSSVHAGSLLSLAVTVGEMKVHAREYATKVVNNSQVLQQDLTQRGFIHPQSPLTKNHQVHITRKNRSSAIKLMKDLKACGILTHVCYGESEGYYVRLGTQEVTRRGMGPDEMYEIARLIDDIASGKDRVANVIKLRKRFTEIQYSFDTEDEAR